MCRVGTQLLVGGSPVAVLAAIHGAASCKIYTEVAGRAALQGLQVQVGGMAWVESFVGGVVR